MTDTICYINQSACHFDRDIIEDFFKKGYSVTLYTGNRSFKYMVEDRKVKIIILKRYNKRNTVSRISSWIIFSIQVTFLLAFKRNCKQFFVSNPPFTVFIPLILKLKKYSFLIYDVYPDILLHTEYLSNKSPFYDLWVWSNKKSFSNAGVVYTIGKGLAEQIRSYSNNKNIVINPLWTDSEKFTPRNKHENFFARQYGLEDSFVVMYSGNLGKTHDVETIVDLAVILQDDQSFKFVIIGDGFKREEIEKRILKEKLKNCIILPKQSMEVFPFSLSSADVTIVSLSASAAKLSIPSKLYNCMAVGAVILAISDEDSDLASIVNEYNIGAVFGINDVDEIVNFLRKLKSDTDLLNTMKSNSRKTSFLHTKANAEKITEALASS